jgi:hypothetical protein
MPQRKPSIKLPEIGECLEQLQILETNVTEEGFQAIGTIKESLEVIKGKWKVLNTNYKNLFQEKTNYEGEIEKMTQFISKMNDKVNEEKTKYSNELKEIQEKFIACENGAIKQLSDNKILIEQLNLDKSELLQELSIQKLDVSKLNDLLNQVKTKGLEEQNEILSLSGKLLEMGKILEDKEKMIGSLKIDNEQIVFALKSKSDELIQKLNILSEIELKNKTVSEEIEKLRVEKDHSIDMLNSKISAIEYEKEKELEKLKDQIQMLLSQKKNAENLLNEMTIKLDKKFKCCLM